MVVYTGFERLPLSDTQIFTNTVARARNTWSWTSDKTRRDVSNDDD